MRSQYTRLHINTVLLIFLPILALIAAGCAPAAPEKVISSPEPGPTNKPIPSQTASLTIAPTTTATAAPTDTPTLTLTATPNRKATEEVRATQTAVTVVQEITDKLERVEFPVPEGHLGWYQPESVAIDMDTHSDAFYIPLDEKFTADDFILKTDVTWRSSGGLMTCGLIFRSEPNFKEGKQYAFAMIRLSGLPAWGIWLNEYGETSRSISKTRTSGAIDQDQMATNEIILIAEGEKFTLYINEERIGSFYDYGKTRLDGYLAFTGSQDSGSSTCAFDDSWVWVIDH